MGELALREGLDTPGGSSNAWMSCRLELMTRRRRRWRQADAEAKEGAGVLFQESALNEGSAGADSRKLGACCRALLGAAPPHKPHAMLPMLSTRVGVAVPCGVSSRSSSKGAEKGRITTTSKAHTAPRTGGRFAAPLRSGTARVACPEAPSVSVRASRHVCGAAGDDAGTATTVRENGVGSSAETSGRPMQQTKAAPSAYPWRDAYYPVAFIRDLNQHGPNAVTIMGDSL